MTKRLPRTKPVPSDPAHIIELRRISCDPKAKPELRLRASLALARLFPEPKPPPPERPRSELDDITPKRRARVDALLGSMDTDWSEYIEPAGWTELHANGISRDDVSRAGYDPGRISRHDGPLPPVSRHLADDDD
jgi:hypothetical protein